MNAMSIVALHNSVQSTIKNVNAACKVAAPSRTIKTCRLYWFTE